MENKYCTGCKETHEISSFSKDKIKKDGLSHYCVRCVNAYGAKNRKRLKALNDSLAYKPAEGFKICFTCKQELETALFNVKSKTFDKLTPSCKSCINDRKIYKPMSEYTIKVIPELLAVEKWLPLKMNGLVFNYLISDCGRFKSLFKNIILKYSFDEDGYPQLTFYGHKKRITKKVHILVGLHHVINPNPELFKELNHEDGDKSNPYAYNLKWCDRDYNLKHRDETGLGCKFTCYNHPCRKPVIKISTGEIFPALKLAAIDSGIPYLGLLIRKGKPVDYKYV